MPDSIDTVFDEEGTRHREGRLEATFRQDPNGKTYLSEQYSSYPYHICRVHYLDKALPDMASLYLQSCSGGIFRDDRVSMHLRAKENTRVHVTTQASTIIHRMEEGFAEQAVQINTEEGSLLEYIPDSVILFPQAKLRTSLTATLHPDSDVIFCDSFLTHDPDGSGEPFGWLESELIIQRPDGRIDSIDRFRLTGDRMATGELPNSKRFSVHGTFFVVSAREDGDLLARALRDCLTSATDVYAGVSRLPNNAGYWVRYIAGDGVSSKQFVTGLWMAAREWLTGMPPNVRRK